MMSIDIRRLRKLDLNLMLAFSVLMRERNVSRAAERLYIGQSAMSAALARLRLALDDPLFIRVGRALEPTARAQALAGPVQRALETLDQAMHAPQAFDPANHEGTFRLGMNDNQELAFVPELVRRLAVQAPRARLAVLAADYTSYSALLDAGRLDAAIALARDLPSWQQSERLFEQGYVCLHAPQQVRLKGRLSLDAYCAHPHALVSFSGDLSGAADTALARIGRTRRVVVGVPRFAALPAMLRAAPLLATVPAPIGRALAASGGLELNPLPFEIPARTVSLVWRSKDTGSPSLAWFLALVKEVARAQVEAASTGRARTRAPAPAKAKLRSGRRGTA